ncbi:MAG: Verru_Chthon cassette protein C [Verrucomicrobiota bacterium]
MPGTRRVAGGERSAARRGVAGVTLIEMLVSVAILLILMTIIFSIIQIASQAWKKSVQSTSAMQQARVAFERMTRNLSQATLNTYYAYYPPGATPPTYYMRQSELQFISGSTPVSGTTPFISSSAGNAAQITHAVFFQAPLGVVDPSNTASYGALNSLLNACGYFVIFGNDTLRPGFFTTLANAPPNEMRFRLMEYLQPSENLGIYTTSAVSQSGGAVPSWISNGIPDLAAAQASPVTVRPLASNIVALIIMPEQFANGASGVQANTAPVSTQANTYNYDSAYQASTLPGGKQGVTANQLPPLVKVIMVAIDEASAIRLAAANPGKTSTSPPNLGQSSLFSNPSQLFTNGSIEGDLDKFQDVLNAKPGNLAHNTIKLNYYIFQTDVIIRGSKWTSS